MSNDVLWIGICVITVLVTVFFATIIFVLFHKLDLIYEIVRHKRWDGVGK